MTHAIDPRPYEQLAAAVVKDALHTIERGGRYGDDGQTRSNDHDRVAAAIRWLRDPGRSAPWLELAGYDHDTVIEALESRGILPPETHTAEAREG